MGEDRGRARIILILIAAGLAPPVAAAQPERAPAEAQPAAVDIAGLIKDLGAQEIDLRIAAHTRLLESRGVTLRRIEEAARGVALSPEQRQRLLTIGFRKFQSEPRAAMGIQPDMTAGRGVGLGGVVQGFGASYVLKPGDRIVAAGGRHISDWNQVRAAIISRDPGEEIPVTVIRDGATLNVNVKLGVFTSLPNAGPLDPAIMERAWEFRSKDMRDPAEAAAEPIPSGLPPAVAMQAAMDVDSPVMMQPVETGPSPVTGVVAGGEPRGGLRAGQTGMLGGGIRLNLPADARQLGGAQDLAQAQVQAQMQLQLVQALRDQLDMQIERNKRQQADPQTPEAWREALRIQGENLAAERRARDLELQKLVNQLTRPQRP